MNIEYIDTIWLVLIITISSIILLPILSWVITHREWKMNDNEISDPQLDLLPKTNAS